MSRYHTSINYESNTGYKSRETYKGARELASLPLPHNGNHRTQWSSQDLNHANRYQVSYPPTRNNTYEGNCDVDPSYDKYGTQDYYSRAGDSRYRSAEDIFYVQPPPPQGLLLFNSIYRVT